MTVRIDFSAKKVERAFAAALASMTQGSIAKMRRAMLQMAMASRAMAIYPILSPVRDYGPPISPRDVPHAGVRAGEIVGHRFWYVLEDRCLRSSFTSQRWEPGQVVSGDVEQELTTGMNPLWGGVYAFNDKEFVDLALENHQEQRKWPHLVPRRAPGENHWPADGTPLALSQPTFDVTVGVVIGTVQLWGEVCEHENGWRAQHAKILEITAGTGMICLGEIQRRYNRGQP